MREMHKWKDKVELSLDNRQIFFLFFGLSVVGCFVFALGVMVGRRVEWNTTGEVAATGSDHDEGALAFLDGDAAREPLSFKDGLATPATEGLPATRDPASIGIDPVADADAPASDRGAALASAAARVDKPSKGESEPAQAREAQTEPAPKLEGKFTLQMKAFATPAEAEAFAETLRSAGHDSRVEAHEVNGRIWHRVRVGAFKTWAEGLAAKESFEKNERVIAYVVRL